MRWCNVTNVDKLIPKLEADIALDKKYYLPFDPLRKRVLMMAFPNGTKDLAGVRKVVEHFQNDVAVLGAAQRTERRQQRRAISRVKEMKPFYETRQGGQSELESDGPGHREHRAATCCPGSRTS